MVALQFHKDFQTSAALGFCYLCGHEFAEVDVTDFDHLPPPQRSVGSMSTLHPVHCVARPRILRVVQGAGRRNVSQAKAKEVRV